MKILFIISIALYAVSVALQFTATAFKKEKFAKAAWLVFLVAFLAHCVFLVVRGIVAGRLPLSNQFEFSCAFAWGIGLLLIYVVEIIVRQFMEPRIVGRQVGLHPLITLIAMFVGSKLFGGVGLLGLPITCAIVQSLDAAGVIHIIKRENSPRPATPNEPTPPPEGSSPLPPEKTGRDEKK